MAENGNVETCCGKGGRNVRCFAIFANSAFLYKKENKPMARIGIFGGSFNPVHNGHIGLARTIVEQGLADEVWLMVSPRNPLKQAEGLMDEQLRLELARAAVGDCPQVRVSDFEFHLPRPSYTWKTLSALQKERPADKFSLVIGADNWHVFHRWAHYEEILRLYNIIMYPRPGYPVEIGNLPPGVCMVDAPLFPCSSTDVREALLAGRDVSEMLPPVVERMLREKGTGLDVSQSVDKP